MSIRLFACALLLAFAGAQAAPPPESPPSKDAPASPADIDVDAMARAKDIDATPADAQPANDGTAGATAAPAVAQDGAAPGTQGAASTNDAAPAADDAAAAGAPSTSPRHEDSTVGGSVPLSPLAPPAAPGDAERRLAAACESRAKSLLDAAQKGDYATATRDFDAKMRSAMPPPKFQQAWESLARFGALQARGQTHPAGSEGYIAVMIPLVFEKANLFAQVTCGSDGLIAGFHVKPLEVPAS